MTGKAVGNRIHRIEEEGVLNLKRHIEQMGEAIKDREELIGYLTCSATDLYPNF